MSAQSYHRLSRSERHPGYSPRERDIPDILDKGGGENAPRGDIKKGERTDTTLRTLPVPKAIHRWLP